MRKGPVVIEMQGPSDLSPAVAPPVPEALSGAQPDPALMLPGSRARSSSWLGRLVLSSAFAVVLFLLSLWAWDLVDRLLATRPVLGQIALGLFAVLGGSALLVCLRELAAVLRLRRIDRLRLAADRVVASSDLTGARALIGELGAFYAHRPDMAWARDRLAGQADQVMDGETLVRLAETELMAAPDQAARREIERAARLVATVTALVPVALADVVAALVANLRMIRVIAAIYGGRPGLFGSWRLMRAVMAHLVATGAVAVGDDLIHSVAGGGLLSKLSRRFGEGVVNGALTARVGIAAMDVCRPLPFAALPRPRVTNIISRALAGLFGRAKGEEARG